MKKYFTIIKMAWQRALTYRFSVYSYRVGEVFWLLAIILMWSVIYDGNQLIKGYSYDQMLSYLLVGNMVDVVVRNWLAGVVGNDIKSGLLSMFLLKPMKYLNYIFAREIGRISFTFLMSVSVQAGLVFLFIKRFYINTDMLVIALIVVMVILAFISEMLLSYLFGLIAFWVDEVDGIYVTAEKIKDVFAGQMFPLALLPVAFVNVSLFMPFAYSFFVPAQLYLKKMDLKTGFLGLGVQIVWIFILYFIISVVWKRGIKKYEGVGI